MAEEKKQERGFTIVDRRGEGRAEEAKPEPGEGPLPSVDFATFALSLGSSALYHMGLVPDPESGRPVAEPNLVLARQTIDTLEMLEAKTRGNLDEQESRLLESLLYELRMRYVEASGRGGESSPGQSS
jgi:hypothetical protein